MKTVEKHTPGPWFVREMARHGEVHGYFVAAADVNGFAYDAEILGEDEYRDGLERWQADARLIAAAPELLAALKSLLEFVRAHSETGEVIPPHTVEHVRAMDAIAKAEPTP